jgi:hypothetical protein
VGRDSSVGIATRYELDYPGIANVQTGPGAQPASCTKGIGSFSGVKWPGRGVDHPAPSSAEVRERVKLYLYSLVSLHGRLQGVPYSVLRLLNQTAGYVTQLSD